MPVFEFWYDHAGLSVPDLHASIAWYEDTLGFTLERTNVVDSIPATIAILRNGNLKIELFELPDAAPASPDRGMPNQDLRTHGHKHISFAVADVHALSEELARRGTDIVWVKKFPFGTNMFIRDNAGNLIEFVERAKPGLAISAL
jgi:methylmalonyl-CoA/ethylmalonyl-CoA epimerase